MYNLGFFGLGLCILRHKIDEMGHRIHDLYLNRSSSMMYIQGSFFLRQSFNDAFTLCSCPSRFLSHLQGVKGMNGTNVSIHKV